MTEQNELHSDTLISRRSFLGTAAGAAVVVCSTVDAAAQSNVLLSSHLPTEVRRCGVGFVLPTGQAEDATTIRKIVDARTLPDRSMDMLERSVRLTIEGLRFPNDACAEKFSHIRFSLMMDRPGKSADSIPWNLWSYERATVINESGSVQADVPLNSNAMLVFRVSAMRTDGTQEHFVTELSGKSKRGYPRLIQGRYCLALCDERAGTFAGIFPEQWNENSDRASISMPHLVINVGTTQADGDVAEHATIA